MKELATYYIQILLPAPILFLIAEMGYSWGFLILLLVYALVYRPLVDGCRLWRKGLIQRSDLKKSFYKAPAWRYKYFKQLYFKQLYFK